MCTFNPEQALARFIELHEKRGQEIDQRPDLQLRMARGNYDFMVDADSEIRELEQEAEQNGYVLQWTFDQDKNDFAYTCEKMTAEEYEQSLEWEKEA
jgi:hypothetical protein